MATSPLGGLVLFSSSLYGAADDPVCGGIMRDGVANGLLHASDAMGMVRVNFSGITPALIGSAGEDFDADVRSAPSVAASTWYMLGGPYGEWPLTMRGDGTPYRLRVRIGGYVANYVAAAAAFRVVIAPTLADALAGRYLEADHIFEANAASGTSAWLTGTSQGSAAAATYVDVTAAQALAWTKRTSTYDAVSASSPVTVDQVLVSAWVFAYVTSTASSQAPVMTALHVSEVLAP